MTVVSGARMPILGAIGLLSLLVPTRTLLATPTRRLAGTQSTSTIQLGHQFSRHGPSASNALVMDVTAHLVAVILLSMAIMVATQALLVPVVLPSVS